MIRAICVAVPRCPFHSAHILASRSCVVMSASIKQALTQVKGGGKIYFVSQLKADKAPKYYHYKGGFARGESLTPERRSQIARKAARARWRKARKEKAVA